MCRIESAIFAWQQAGEPSLVDGAYVFNLTLDSTGQPLYTGTLHYTIPLRRTRERSLFRVALAAMRFVIQGALASGSATWRSFAHDLVDPPGTASGA